MSVYLTLLSLPYLTARFPVANASLLSCLWLGVRYFSAASLSLALLYRSSSCCPTSNQALEKQKEYVACLREERDTLREELADLKGTVSTGEVGRSGLELVSPASFVAFLLSSHLPPHTPVSVLQPRL